MSELSLLQNPSKMKPPNQTMPSPIHSFYKDLPIIEPEFCEWLHREKLREAAGRPTYCRPLPLDPDYDPDYDYSDYILIPTMEILSSLIAVPDNLPPMAPLPAPHDQNELPPPPPPPPAAAEGAVVEAEAGGSGSGSGSRKRKGRPTRLVNLDVTGRPPWLPADWTFNRKLRENGKAKGMNDWVFTSPCGNRNFRSKSNVDKFLDYQQMLLNAQGEDVGRRLRKRKSSSCKKP